MAYIATIKIVVDETNESVVYDGLNEVLRDAQYGGPNGENQGWIVDWKFESVERASKSLDDSIANGAYSEGDAFVDSNRDSEQAFSPFKLVIEAYPTCGSDGAPSWAEITVTREFLQELERLSLICRDNALEIVTVMQNADAWEDTGILLTGDRLHVSNDSFWFDTSPKHDEYTLIETRAISIDRLIQVAKAIDGNKAGGRLPNKFSVRNGIVFYDSFDPKTLEDWYLERE